MGEVYLAEDPRLGRQLALKLLPAEFTQDANRRARFLTEARAAAALNHPNICTVYDAGETAEGVHETARILKDFQEAIGRGLHKFSQARQEASLGSALLLSFARPSNAVQWALEVLTGASAPLQCRAGLHLGEVAAAMGVIRSSG